MDRISASVDVMLEALARIEGSAFFFERPV